jgi:formylglycine-generating enzyme required for sulfatase activity
MAVDISVLDNDTDADGDTLSVSSLGGAASHGTVTKNTNGTVHYVPTTGYSGTDTFTYMVNGGVGGTDTGLVTVTVVGSIVPGTWVTISASTFMFGSSTSKPCRFSNESQHQVTLTHGFESMSMEVTQGQFQSAMGYNPSLNKACGSTCPVSWVSWSESVSYCNALSKKAGLTPCYVCSGKGIMVDCWKAFVYKGQAIYSCPGYRLSTEAKGKYAYRAGTGTAFYNGPITDCTSDWNADAIGWYDITSKNVMHPVGQKVPNA